MLEVGWSELLVIAIILIVVVGPKDLPAMMRTFGRVMGRVRTMANEFRGQFDEAMREAELDDVRKGLDEVKKYSPSNSIRDAINPIRQMGQDIKSDLQKASTVSTAKSTPVDEGTPLDELMADPAIDPEPATAAAEPARPAQTVAAAEPKPAQAAAATASAAATTATAATTVSAPAESEKIKPAAKKPAKAKASDAADYPPPATKVVKRKAAEKHVEHDVKVASADVSPKPPARKAAPKVKAEPAVKIVAAKPKPAPKKKTAKTGDA